MCAVESKTAQPNIDGCRLWTGTTASEWGYGQMTYRGKGISAHRATWVAHHGPIPLGLNVCHKCDIRRCCEISHLFLGTQAENLSDMRAKGRGAKSTPNKGENHAQTKITKATGLEIYALCQDGMKHTEISARYGVSAPTVSEIARNKHWSTRDLTASPA